jgi:hypothetical protein
MLLFLVSYKNFLPQVHAPRDWPGFGKLIELDVSCQDNSGPEDTMKQASLT